MNNDTWSLLDVNVGADEAELVSDTLWSLGVVAIEEITAADGRVVLRTSMGDDPVDAAERIRAVHPSARVDIVEHDRAVADTWRRFAAPTAVTDTVSLVPAWCEPPSGITPVFVEPLDTFGLGNHPTTVLALRLALTHAPAGSTVFDFGSGSGVLAVALAAVKGCDCIAHDIAASARRALVTNMELNNVTSCRWFDDVPATPVDVVVANILAPVLESESARITGCLRPGGVLVLSGLRDEQVHRVLGHYAGYTELTRESAEGWCAVALRKD